MSEILGKLMEILYKRGYVEYHSSLYANVLKEYNLEVPGLRLILILILIKTKKLI